MAIPLQTNYTTTFARGSMGAIANEEKYNAISRTVETAAGLPFGNPAYRSATAANVHNCRAYAASALFLGIAVKTIAPEGVQNGGTLVTDGYSQYTTAALMTEGQMYVLVNATVAAGDAVYWDNTAKRYTNVTTNNVAIPGAFFDTAGVNGDIVEISLAHRVA